ncbi:MAG: YHS domain-containing protein [Chloroflexi bacterium]|jgi:Cu+-exporting ATPase|nr:YHS domain-containing protein [Chloroflexota bacterium]
MSIAIDPVCGMEVETDTAQHRAEHDGASYYFCGKGCRLDFEEDPPKYLAPDYQPSM